MTERERFNIADQKREIMELYGYTCQRCGRVAVFLAHRIAQTKNNIRKYGKENIHHWLNLVPVCYDQSCNDSFNIGNRPAECRELLTKIAATPPILELENPREYIDRP